MSMNQDRFSGTGKNFGGQAEEGFERVTGDVKTEGEGKMKQAAGAAQPVRTGERRSRRRGKIGSRAGCAVGGVSSQYYRNPAVHRSGRGARAWLVHRPHGRPCRLLTPLDPRRSSETVAVRLMQFLTVCIFLLGTCGLALAQAVPLPEQSPYLRGRAIHLGWRR